MGVPKDATAQARSSNAAWRQRGRLHPPRQRVPLCRRLRVLRSLGIARACKLSLLIAPAGYGKTTALSQWVDQLSAGSIKVAWCTLSAREAEAGEFLRIVARALHAGGIDMTDTGLLLDGDIHEDAALDAILLKLERTTGDIVLILDDFDAIQDSAPVQLLDELLGMLPPHAHIVVSARQKPPFGSLSPLRTQGQVRIIEPEELRLDPDEIRELLQDHVPADHLEDVAEWTRGWPVAVQLFRLWREHGGGDNLAYPPRWPTESVADYLSEQVFNALSDEQRRFLADISILDEIDPDAANHVRDADDALRLLRELQLLLPSLIETAQPSAHPIFRLHPLVAEAARASFPLEGSRAATLHRRAAGWYLEHQRPIDALRHAAAMNDVGVVTEILGSIAPLHIFLRSGLGELKAFIREIPPPIVEQEPRLQLMLAFIHFKTGFFTEALRALERITLDGDDPQREIERLAIRTTCRIYVGDCDQTLDRDLERLRELTPTDPLMWAWRVNLQIVLHEQRGELLQARKAIDQCDTIYDIQGIGFASFHLMIHRMLVNLAEGSLRLIAGDVGRMLKRRRAEFSSDVPVLSMARLAEASLSYERRPSEAVEEVINQSLEQFGDSESWFEQRAIAAPILADIAFYRNGPDAVAEFADRWQRWSAERGVIYLQNLLPLLRARYLLLASRVEEAEALLQPFLVGSDAGAERYPRWREREFLRSVLVLYGLAKGDIDGARDQALRLMTEAREGGRLRGTISGHILLARVHHARGEMAEACAEMLAAVRAAHPEGYVMPFTEGGPSVRYILEALANDPAVSPIERRHIELTIRSFTLQPLQNPHDLSRREIDILRHLAEGVSNKLIARRMDITENTVKFHLKKAFQKMGVTSRRAASAAFEAEREAGCYP